MKNGLRLEQVKALEGSSEGPFRQDAAPVNLICILDTVWEGQSWEFMLKL